MESRSRHVGGSRDAPRRVGFHGGELANITVQVLGDPQRARVSVAGGSSLELPIIVWQELLARIEIEQARLAGCGGTSNPSFGSGPGRVGPGRHGADWSAHEMSALVRSFRAGETVASLALAHQRTTGAVEQKLHRLGLVRAADRQFGGPHGAPDWLPPGGDAPR